MSDQKYQSLKKSMTDALYYLNRPGTSAEDEIKAIRILEARVEEGSPGLPKAIAKAGPPSGKLKLKGKHLAVVVGHEPGGGAANERNWNIKLARIMKAKVEAAGGTCFVYLHKIKSYGARQNAMRTALDKQAAKQKKDFDCAFELHYNGVSYPSAHGYEYHYRGAKKFAQAVAKHHKKAWPQTTARGDGKSGSKKSLKGNGAGFLLKCPCWAVLVEPFFRSNPEEWAFFKDNHDEVADVYLAGASDFLA